MATKNFTLSTFTRNDIVTLLVPVLSDNMILLLVRLCRRIYFFLRRGEQRETEENIRDVMKRRRGSGERAAEKCIEQYYENSDYHDLERLILTTNSIRTERFFNEVSMSGLEHLKAQYKKKKGLLLFAPHYGAYSLVILRRGIPGSFPITIVIKPPSQNLENRRLLHTLSTLRNTHALLWDRNIAMNMLRALDHNRIVVLFADRANFADKNKNVVVSLFGRKVYTQRGLAFLAKNRDVPILCIYGRRVYAKGSLRYMVTISRPILKKEDYQRSEQEIMQIAYRELESLVEGNPQDWQRWRYFEKMKVV